MATTPRSTFGVGVSQNAHKLTNKSAIFSTRAHVRAFTLIELLVVIAIIGILSAVVLASLNTARDRGREAAIRSTLKNMASEVELHIDTNGGNYNFVNNCTSTSSPLNKFVVALQAQGAQVACDAFTFTTAGVVDAYSRWGVAASFSGSATPIVAFAASQDGIIKFDETNTANTSWVPGVSACATAGKRMATPEELRSLYKAHGNGTPPGFDGSPHFWSFTTVPGSESNRAYFVNLANGNPYDSGFGNQRFIRCGS